MESDAEQMSGWTRWLTWTVAVALVLGALAVITVARISPHASLPNDRLHVYLSSRCRFSQHLLHQITARPELLEHVVPVPTDGSASNMEGVCDLALASMDDASIRLLPKAVACERLIRDAREFHADNFAHFPAWSVGDAPISLEDQAEELQRRGLRHDRRTNRIGLAGEDLSSPDPWLVEHSSPTRQPTHSLLEDAIAHTIGM